MVQRMCQFLVSLAKSVSDRPPLRRAALDVYEMMSGVNAFFRQFEYHHGFYEWIESMKAQSGGNPKTLLQLFESESTPGGLLVRKQQLAVVDLCAHEIMALADFAKVIDTKRLRNSLRYKQRTREVKDKADLIAQAISVLTNAKLARFVDPPADEPKTETVGGAEGLEEPTQEDQEGVEGEGNVPEVLQQPKKKTRPRGRKKYYLEKSHWIDVLGSEVAQRLLLSADNFL